MLCNCYYVEFVRLYISIFTASDGSTVKSLPITQHKVPFRDTRELKKGPRELLMHKCHKPQEWRRAVNVNRILQSSVKYLSQSLMSTIRSWYQSLVSLIGGMNRMSTGSVASFALAGAWSQARLYWLVNWLSFYTAYMSVWMTFEWRSDTRTDLLTVWESGWGSG